MEDKLFLWYYFNTDYLNIPSIWPTSIVQYFSSLIGKDFKIILQDAPLIFFHFKTPLQFEIWSFGFLNFSNLIKIFSNIIIKYSGQCKSFLENKNLKTIMESLKRLQSSQTTNSPVQKLNSNSVTFTFSFIFLKKYKHIHASKKVKNIISNNLDAEEIRL
ncbi:hypothetical protein VP01_1525g6 [Puccinia sorghi]|uniref:Uncharacterized protein n=1 Tax=Puccinia sorghi TaxID=27349 RepID=A0A0L6VKI7_9BASI|nr:hypothetical protein VP01_1525g6 [Puccinia sorghi]